MAKFCANCGAPMEDTDRVCGNCGTPAEMPAAQPTWQQPAQPTWPQQPAAGMGMPAGGGTVPPNPMAPAAGAATGNSKQIIKLGAIGIAAIVVVVVLVNVIGAFTGDKGAIRKMVKALQNYDMATLSSLASSINEEAVGFYIDDVDKYYDQQVTYALDEMEDDVGTIKKLSYEIVDITEISKRRTEDIKDQLIDDYNMDVGGIKKMESVELRLTAKGSKKSATYYVDNLYLIKEDGGWKFYYGSSSFF